MVHGLGKFQSVENMQSARGNDVPNQFKIYFEKGVVFQSYSTFIAVKFYNDRKTVLDKNSWDYSVTTGKYRIDFLQEDKAETLAKIDAGDYVLRDLNRE